jgi:hypothetical protein
MPDFSILRKQLNETQGSADMLKLGIFNIEEKIKQLNSREQQLNRLGANSPIYIKEQGRLDQERRKLKEEWASKNKSYQSDLAKLSGIWKGFSLLTNPISGIQAFSSEYPILLFPVRLETRFKTVQNSDGVSKPQLWVRIYPDECLVDTFEETLTEKEVQNAQRYWAGIWVSVGNENLERSYWRNLVASHGTGRASYIVDYYKPDTATSSPKPTTVDNSKFHLVIATNTLLANSTEKTAIENYWTSFWRADGNEAIQKEAFDILVIATSNEQATLLIETYIPANIKETLSNDVNRQTTPIEFLYIIFPKDAGTMTKNHSWSHAPKVKILPERFMLFGENNIPNNDLMTGNDKGILGNPIKYPLVAGPNPTAPEDKQFKIDDKGNLFVPEEMKWMVDFDEAVSVGMGFKIDISPFQATNGFDRLYVLGIRLGSNETESKQLLNDHFEHHLKSRTGFSIIPQGTPTNNTEKEGSGFTRTEDADFMFDFLKKSKDPEYQNLFDSQEQYEKKDGTWFAEMLGLSKELIYKTPHADETGLCEARAMNTALWPATMGYWMDTQMDSVFDTNTIHRTRDFFTEYISGRGMIPAIRIGKQPYGILATTAFSNMQWLRRNDDREESRERRFLQGLYKTITDLDNLFWKGWSENAPHVSNKSDKPQQTLLDILALNPSSVEYYQQWQQSEYFFWLVTHYMGRAYPKFLIDIRDSWLTNPVKLLSQLGYNGEKNPDILEKIFLEEPNLLKGPVIDDRPLSEKDPIRAYTADNRNYIQWLKDGATNNLEIIRKEEGLKEKPIALLYILLRYALEMGYHDVSNLLYLNAEVIDSQQYAQLKREPAILHVADKADVSDSRYKSLYSIEPKITFNQDIMVHEYIAKELFKLPVSRYLSKQITALEHLQNTSTARLERAFAEHIDLCTYRLDAWWSGLVNYQLHHMRQVRNTEGGAFHKEGIFLGAFGWVEDLRPENKALRPKTLPENLNEIFNNNDKEAPLVQDPTNGGYVFAPSLNQAVTAAVLRNGYISNATPKTPDLMNINLSSQRVRIALQFLEGIRNGQSLGALLGYHFERGLHDRHNESEVDLYIYKIRRAFPLVVKTANETHEEKTAAIQAIEASNVVDGLKLIEQINKKIKEIQENNAILDKDGAIAFAKKYPWGLGEDKLAKISSIPSNKLKIIDEEVERLLDIHDAIADLALSESVHQIVQGNYDRAAAALDTYGKATFPSIPDIAITPRSGITLTHRVGIHLPIIQLAPITSKPRQKGEPALEAWLAQTLPDPNNIIVHVQYDDPASEIVEELPLIVTWKDLNLDLIDMLYILNPESEGAMAEVDDRILHHVFNLDIGGGLRLRPDTSVKILYTLPNTDISKVSFFQIAPLIKSLRALILESRYLKAGDVMLQNEATNDADSTVFIPVARITQIKDDMKPLQLSIQPFMSALKTDIGLLIDKSIDPVVYKNNLNLVITHLDAHYNLFIKHQLDASRYAINLSGIGAAMDWKKLVFRSVFNKAKEVEISWNQKKTDFETLMATYDATASDEVRIEILRKAERLISNQYTIVTNIAAFEAIMINKKNTFDNAHTDVISFNISIPNPTTFTDLLGQFKLLIPAINSINLGETSLDEEEKKVLPFLEDLHNQMKGVDATIKIRTKATDGFITIANASTGEKKVTALKDAIKSLLGDDFCIIPHFSISAKQGDEWQNAVNHKTKLLEYAEKETPEKPSTDFPVDDWLYGMARVRPKMTEFENIIQLTEAFNTSKIPELYPIQLPYNDKESWLAVDFPTDPDVFDITKSGDHLLYTAHYATGFAKNDVQCGLLIDEWTEVIPTKEETAGLTFHYDRPNNEPPQTLLLVTPSIIDKVWHWDDLVNALKETFAMAKRRAVIPRNIEPTALARFLPATMAPVTGNGISITANLADNNKYADKISANPNG